MFFPEEEQLRAKQITAHLATGNNDNIIKPPPKSCLQNCIYLYFDLISELNNRFLVRRDKKKYAKQYKLQKFLIELTQKQIQPIKNFLENHILCRLTKNKIKIRHPKHLSYTKKPRKKQSTPT